MQLLIDSWKNHGFDFGFEESACHLVATAKRLLAFGLDVKKEGKKRNKEENALKEEITIR